MAAALIIIGSLLVLLNAISIKREKESFSSTLNVAEVDMTEFEVEIGNLRKEFAESLSEIQSEVEKLKIKIEEDDYKENDREQNNVLISEIEDMLSEGLTIEEISKKLNIAKGEILLIKELYLK